MIRTIPNALAGLALAATVAVAAPAPATTKPVVTKSATPVAALPISPHIPETAAPAFHVADPIVRKLSNGMTVAVFPSSRLPIVQMQLFVPAGILAEPKDQLGVAWLTAQMLRAGTSSRDVATFRSDLDHLGGSFSAAASRDNATLNGAFLSRDFEAGLELLSDAALNPVFPESELRNLRTQAIRSLADRAADLSATADAQIWSLVFGDHPYGRPPFGTQASIGAVTAEQVRAFYHDHFRPNTAVLAIAGDVTPERVFAAVEDRFGRWSGTSTESPRTQAPSPKGIHIRIVDVPTADHAELRLGLPLPGRSSDDDLPLTLAATLLGGGDDSRLRSLEVRRMLGNAVAANILTLHDGGLFFIGTAVRTDSAASAAQFVRRQLRSFLQHPPDEAELAPTRRVSLATYSQPLETLGGQMGQWLGQRSLGLATGSEDKLPARLAALTAAELDAAAARWLDPDRASIVVVGPALKLREQFESMGTVEVVSNAATPIQGSAVDTVVATPERIARAKGLLHLVLDAHGGETALRGIHDSVVEAELDLEAQGRSVTGQVTQTRKEPMRMRTITQFGNLETTQILNGDEGWNKGSVTGEVVPVEGIQLDGLKAAFYADLPHLLLRVIEPTTRAVYRGTERVDGRDAEAIELVNEEGERSRLYVDPKTHLVIALDENETNGGAVIFATRRIYRDYRKSQGIVWPFEEQRTLEGQNAVHLMARKVSMNLGVSDKLFERPEPTQPKSGN